MDPVTDAREILKALAWKCDLWRLTSGGVCFAPASRECQRLWALELAVMYPLDDNDKCMCRCHDR